MTTNARNQACTCATIGHSTHRAEQLIGLLRANRVELLVDVRTVPRSRHNPQFDRDTLAQSLAETGLGYYHCKALGGLRKPRRDSVNDGWKNASFRGYADYMQTPAFEQALEELLTRTADRRLAIMCAEAVPWRCHRSLIADVITARGGSVGHIIGNTTQLHRMTSFAVVTGGQVTYPSGLQP